MNFLFFVILISLKNLVLVQSKLEIISNMENPDDSSYIRTLARINPENAEILYQLNLTNLPTREGNLIKIYSVQKKCQLVLAHGYHIEIRDCETFELLKFWDFLEEFCFDKTDYFLSHTGKLWGIQHYYDDPVYGEMNQVVEIDLEHKNYTILFHFEPLCQMIDAYTFSEDRKKMYYYCDEGVPVGMIIELDMEKQIVTNEWDVSKDRDRLFECFHYYDGKLWGYKMSNDYKYFTNFSYFDLSEQKVVNIQTNVPGQNPFWCGAIGHENIYYSMVYDGDEYFWIIWDLEKREIITKIKYPNQNIVVKMSLVDDGGK